METWYVVLLHSQPELLTLLHLLPMIDFKPGGLSAAKSTNSSSSSSKDNGYVESDAVQVIPVSPCMPQLGYYDSTPGMALIVDGSHRGWRRYHQAKATQPWSQADR